MRLKPHLAICDDESDQHICPAFHARGLDLWSIDFRPCDCYGDLRRSICSAGLHRFEIQEANQCGQQRTCPIYGSTRVELAWTIIPVLLVVALFLAVARVIAFVQDPPRPSDALEVIATGHPYWWEYRYPQLNIVTANELHVPVSDAAHRRATFLTLL
jgi:cytochrome c oxidase subunit 2